MQEPESLAELREHLFVDVPTVGRVVYGVGEARSYVMANEGSIPGVVRQGRRMRVNVPKLLAALHADAAQAPTD